METLTLQTCDMERVKASDLCRFLADYGANLMASGATCIRLDKNVRRIAAAYGMDAEMTVMPRHIHLTAADTNTGEVVTSISKVPGTGISFAQNTDLSRLSWEIADHKMSYAEAVKRYEGIKAGGGLNAVVLLLLVSLANASFCRLFGGDIAAMIVVGVATLAGYYIKMLLLAHKVDVRVVFMACAFVSSVIGATDMLFSIGTTPDVALGTSVLYLVPGIPFLNSFSDMLYRHYLCAFARFADALILTCSLSVGLCAGMWLMRASMF